MQRFLSCCTSISGSVILVGGDMVAGVMVAGVAADMVAGVMVAGVAGDMVAGDMVAGVAGDMVAGVAGCGVVGHIAIKSCSMNEGRRLSECESITAHWSTSSETMSFGHDSWRCRPSNTWSHIVFSFAASASKRPRQPLRE